MPKGEKIRPKQEMDQLPLENFENSRIEILFCQNTLIVSFFVKSWSLVGRRLNYGKKGEFLNPLSISCGISLFMFQQVCLT
jgi:hypothetical protein